MNILFKFGFVKESKDLGAWGENSQQVTFVTYVFWSLNYSVYVLFQRGQMSKLVQVQVKFHESKERKKVIYDFAWNEGPKNLPPKFFLESILENLCEVSQAGARLYVVQMLDCHSHEISYHGHWIWDMFSALIISSLHQTLKLNCTMLVTRKSKRAFLKLQENSSQERTDVKKKSAAIWNRRRENCSIWSFDN